MFLIECGGLTPLSFAATWRGPASGRRVRERRRVAALDTEA